MERCMEVFVGVDVARTRNAFTFATKPVRPARVFIGSSPRLAIHASLLRPY